MKTTNQILIPIILLTQLLYQCKTGTKQNLSEINPIATHYEEKETVQKDTIEIHFDNSITLIWDNANSQFIQKNVYNDILQSQDKINILVENIKNNEDLKMKLCTKTKSNLKKGDIAFLFLYKNQKIFLFSCLKMQFDNIDECFIPSELMDYIDDNRIKIYEQVKNCIKN